MNSKYNLFYLKFKWILLAPDLTQITIDFFLLKSPIPVNFILIFIDFPDLFHLYDFSDWADENFYFIFYFWYWNYNFFLLCVYKRFQFQCRFQAEILINCYFSKKYFQMTIFHWYTYSEAAEKNRLTSSISRLWKVGKFKKREIFQEIFISNIVAFYFDQWGDF